MAKKPAQAAAAPAKAVTKTINRKRRNALERKCLPKALKTLYANSGKETFRAVLKAWQDGRKKTAPTH